MNISDQLESILKYAKPFVFGHQIEKMQLNWNVFGPQYDPEFLKYETLNLSSVDFGEMLLRLDALSFGESAMAMEKWVMFDCGMMPGLITGMAIPRSLLPTNFAAKILPSHVYEDYVPISMYIAIPKHSGEFLAHNLSSLAQFLPGLELKGLGTITKAMGISLARMKSLYGATQWDNTASIVHRKFGPLKLLSAYTPLHSHARSWSYRCDFENTDSIFSILENPGYTAGNFSLTSELEDDELIRWQKKLEKGLDLWIVDRPHINKSGVISYQLK